MSLYLKQKPFESSYQMGNLMFQDFLLQEIEFDRIEFASLSRESVLENIGSISDRKLEKQAWK